MGSQQRKKDRQEAVRKQTDRQTSQQAKNLNGRVRDFKQKTFILPRTNVLTEERMNKLSSTVYSYGLERECEIRQTNAVTGDTSLTSRC